MFSEDTPLSERIFNGRLIDFLVLSRAQAAAFSAETPYLIISVTDPENPQAVLAESPFLKAILRLKFHDIGQPSQIAAQFNTGSPDVYMTGAEAGRIFSLLTKYLSAVSLIVCHCEQGISRSAAIAAALSCILQDEDEFFFQNYWVNRYIYDLLSANAGELKDSLQKADQLLYFPKN